jgi:hypothetical protein
VKPYKQDTISLHVWWVFAGITCCRVCGTVQRRDGANGPCKGPVKVTPR